MPVYEFYCSACHTIFNFLAKTADAERKPACPKCRKPELERKVSHFAISSGRKDESSGGEIPEIDEAKLEKALMGMASEFDGADENDPRQMAKMMRRLSEATGMNLGGGFEEAIRRLESGEDPEVVEAEMGDVLDDSNIENLFAKDGLKGLKRRYTPPAHDETLYRFDLSEP
ncbi:zinc ribbon domain-containing protein [Geobacter pelophilus]|uniref:Zinc ribbon domain-containing protein n=1 Tax=Geoanaerobacter pelophilus TaxID=60036 RepID=A0AAW4LCD0_9BACT|nr:FmdB family zinc ribbon protein [Geoanaerobacter pelophilus]MBT0666066.1 zinc ribbon domain-containing protein [Geoanaerobacter pelophilus]